MSKIFSPKSVVPRIDVHHHAIPKEYAEAVTESGFGAAHGAGFPAWTKDMSLEMMEKNGIAVVVNSISSPGVYFGDAAFAAKLARLCNEHMAQIAADNPSRFGFFAALPMPATELALKETEYALDELWADGIGLLASSSDKFLGDPDFDELMAELDRRKSVIYVHPNLHSSSDNLGLDMPGFYIEFLFDTTRAVANLVTKGTLERFPNIRWILSHAGGTVPYIAWRLSLADFNPKVSAAAPRGILHYLKSLYYDTALSTSPYAMRAVLELVMTFTHPVWQRFSLCPGVPDSEADRRSPTD